jgi:tryptophan synthase beta chain
VRYTYCTDQQALAAFQQLARCEGILPALESSHAIAIATEEARHGDEHEIVIVCLSGRGDKDASEVAKLLEMSAADDSQLKDHRGNSVDE